MAKIDIKDETVVKVDFATLPLKDTTIGELRALFKDQSREWQDSFFTMLTDYGAAYGPLARYHIPGHRPKK